MARGINKVILVGHVGQDPEMNYSRAESAMCNISVATTRSWKDKQTGQKQERTEWHRVSMFKRLAEIAGEYLTKGSQVYIEGRLQTRKWQDKSGADRYTREIIAHEMQMLGGGSRRSTPPAGRPQDKESSCGQADLYGPRAEANARAGAGMDKPSGQDDFDDDIPF